MWNSLMILSCFLLLNHLLLHLIFHKSRHYPFRLKQISVDQSYKVLIKSIEITVKTTGIVMILLHVVSYYLFSSKLDLIIYGLPWMIIWTLFIIKACNILLWNAFYFNIMTIGLKYQLKFENTKLKRLIRSKTKCPVSISIKNLMNKLDKIHSKISLNNKFWSYYLFSFCLTLGSLIEILIFQLLDENDVVIMIFFIYMLIFVPSMLSLILYSAIRVHNEANISLKLMNKFLFCPKVSRIPIALRLKV